jgi:hypothetical protein
MIGRLRVGATSIFYLYEMASVSLTPRPLHLWGKNFQQPFNWQLDGPQRECGRSEEETNPYPYRE